MPIRYALLKRLLMVLFDLSANQSHALSSRFKHLQANAMLPEQRVGPSWAKYSLEDMLRIVVTFELIDIGLSPVHALRIIDTHWPAVHVAFASAWLAGFDQEGEPQVAAHVWEIVPHALTEIGSDTALRDVPIADQAGVVGRENSRAPMRARHKICVDLGWLLAALFDAFRVEAPQLIASVSVELDRFASDVVSLRPERPIYRA